jgi:hypothetical protein
VKIVINGANISLRSNFLAVPLEELAAPWENCSSLFCPAEQMQASPMSSLGMFQRFLIDLRVECYNCIIVRKHSQTKLSTPSLRKIKLIFRIALFCKRK